MISQGLGRLRNGIFAPIGGKVFGSQILDQALLEGDLEDHESAKKLRRFKVDQNFQGGQGAGCRGVDHGGTGGVPTASEEACTFTAESVLGMTFLDDAPGG